MLPFALLMCPESPNPSDQRRSINVKQTARIWFIRKGGAKALQVSFCSLHVPVPRFCEGGALQPSAYVADIAQLLLKQYRPIDNLFTCLLYTSPSPRDS